VKCLLRVVHMSKKNPTFASTNGASHNQPRETMSDNELTMKEQHLLLMKTECEIRNAMNLLTAEIPSLEFGPLGKAFDLVWEACRLLEEASREANRKAWLEQCQEMGWVD